jgi:hypothetical protein
MPSKETPKLLMAGNSFIFLERMLDAIPRSRLLSKHGASEERVKIPNIRHLTRGLEQLFVGFPSSVNGCFMLFFRASF